MGPSNKCERFFYMYMLAVVIFGDTGIILHKLSWIFLDFSGTL